MRHPRLLIKGISVRFSMTITNNALSFELNHQRAKLDFYTTLNTTKPSPAVSTWIEIYSERVKKIEKQIARLQNAEAKAGLRTALGSASTSTAKKSG